MLHWTIVRILNFVVDDRVYHKGIIHLDRIGAASEIDKNSYILHVHAAHTTRSWWNEIGCVISLRTNDYAITARNEGEYRSDAEFTLQKPPTIQPVIILCSRFVPWN